MYQQTDELAALVARKHQVLTHLRDLGARQAELIERNELDLLLRILASKQRLLEELTATDRRLDTFRGQDPEQRRWRAPDDRVRTSRLAAECERMLLQIVAQEKESERIMSSRRDDTGGRLDGAHVAARAHGAYHQSTAGGASQLDLTSGQ